MNQLAERLDTLADAVATVDRSVPRLAIGTAAFGADDAGVPGRLGRALHARWLAVLDARSHEAASAAARLSELAGGLRAAERMYADTDASVARRVEREA